MGGRESSVIAFQRYSSQCTERCCTISACAFEIVPARRRHRCRPVRPASRPRESAARKDSRPPRHPARGAVRLGKSTALHKLAVDLRNAGQRAVLVNAGAGRSASDLLALVTNELDLPDLQPDPNLATPVVSLVRSVRQLAQAPESVILLDDPHHPDSAYELFGRLREELWALPHQWVVAIRAGQSPSTATPTRRRVLSRGGRGSSAERT